MPPNEFSLDFLKKNIQNTDLSHVFSGFKEFFLESWTLRPSGGHFHMLIVIFFDIEKYHEA